MENSPKQAKKLIGYLPEGAPAYGEMTTIGFLNFIALDEARITVSFVDSSPSTEIELKV